MNRKRFQLLNVSKVSTDLEALNPNKKSEFSKVSNVSSEARKKPYIKNCSELILPMDAADKYRWWAGGQSVFDTLLELDALNALIESHLDGIGSSKNWERWKKVREERLQSDLNKTDTSNMVTKYTSYDPGSCQSKSRSCQP
jgi:hypothetical protein